MSFARSVDHLDGDQRSFFSFVVPRPNSSAIYRVRDDRLAAHAIVAGDVVVIDRDQPLQAGRIALVRVGESSRLVVVVRNGTGFGFDGLRVADEPIEILGIASRVVRALIP